MGVDVLVEEFTEARSAKAPGLRPVFAEMVGRLRAGEADGIFCWHVNRLFRNPVDYGEVAWMLQTGVIKVIRTVDREYGPQDVLLMAVEAGLAAQYSVDLGKVVRRGLDSKAERGWFPNRAYPGYLNNKETKQIDPHPTDFALVRRAWELLFSGSRTIPQVHEQAQAWGGPRISLSNFYLLFSNPFYYGFFRYKGRLWPGKHRSMVTKAEFDRVQELIHKPTTSNPRN